MGGEEGIEMLFDLKDENEPDPLGPDVGWGYTMPDENLSRFAGAAAGNTVGALTLFTILPPLVLTAKDYRDTNLSQEEFVDQYLESMDLDPGNFEY